MWMAIAGIVMLLLLVGALIREARLSRRLERQLDTLHAQQIEASHRVQYRIDQLHQCIEALDADAAPVETGPSPRIALRD